MASKDPGVETDLREALQETNHRLRRLLKRLSDAGMADNNENLKREVRRSRRQTRANREILGRATPTAKKGKAPARAKRQSEAARARAI